MRGVASYARHDKALNAFCAPKCFDERHDMSYGLLSTRFGKSWRA